MEPTRRRLSSHQGFVSLVLAIALGVSSLIAIVGSGNASTVIGLFDGSAWLPSNQPGEVAHVNGAAADVDAQIQFKGAAGQQLQVIQQGKHVYVRNLQAGTVSRIDATALEVHQGQTASVSATDEFAANQSVSFDITQAGVVQQLDPTTLQGIGRILHVKGPITGSVVDSHNNLWLVSKGTGRLIEIHDGRVLRDISVAAPGSNLGLALAGDQPVVIDESDARVILIEGDRVAEKISLPGVSPGTTITFAPTSPTNVLAVVVPQSGALLSIDTSDGQLSSRGLGGRAGHDFGTPQVASDGTVYVPDFTTGQLVSDKGNQPPVDYNFASPGTKFEVVVKDSSVFLNNPDSQDAAVLNHGVLDPVDKYQPDVAGNITPITPPPVPTPVPQAPLSQPTTAPVTIPNAPTQTAPSTAPTTPPTTPPTTALQAPSAPTGVSATATSDGSGQATVTFSPPASDGGSPITSYTVTASTGQSASGAGTSITVGGLAIGASVTFTVTATNTVGTGPASGPSNVVTPTAPPPPPPPPPPPSISIGVGGSADGQPGCTVAACHYVAVTLSNFSGAVSVACTSNYGGVFYTYSAGDGASSVCYFGYPGYSVWVTAGGVTSNTISWP